jgi:group I intron endonuclease
MAFIYKITNKINGKVYIGKTEKENPYERFEEHKQDYKKERKEIRPLYRAFNKYGIENFSFEILEQSEMPEEREVFYIQQFNSYVGFNKSNGYNATLGGDGKKYIDDLLVVEKYIQEEENSIKKIAKELKIDVGSISTILKKYKVKIRDPKLYTSLKVLQIDKKTRQVLNEFESLSDAALYLKDERKRQHITEVCQGRRKSAYGYIWKFKE